MCCGADQSFWPLGIVALLSRQALAAEKPAFVPLVAAQDDRQGKTVTSVSVLIALGSAPAASRPRRAGIPRIG
jgi:hypothetical protein